MENNTETSNQDHSQTTTTQTDGDAGKVNDVNTDTGADAQAAAFAQEQADVMGEILDMAGGGTPAQTEPEKGQPNQAEAAGADTGKNAPQPGADETSPDDKQPDGQQGDTKTGDDKKPEPKPETVSPEAVVDVATDDGMRQVPVKNLVTTYNQYRHLQGLHEQVKPMFDLARGTGIAPGNLFPYLRLGIETAQAIKNGKQVPGMQANQAASENGYSGGYDGPFKDQAEDDRLKEVDPSMHTMAVQLHNRNRQLEQSLNQMLQRFTSMSNAGADTSADEQRQGYIQTFNTKMGEFAKDHANYFAMDPETKVSERLEVFKQFLARNYGHLDVDHDLTPETLTIAFQRFDPQYVATYQAKLVEDKHKKLLAQQNATFGETSHARTGTPAGKLDEQQQVMAEIL